MRIAKFVFFLIFGTIINIPLQCQGIHEHGYWIGEDLDHEHAYDHKLSNQIVKFLKSEKAHLLVDFGCGKGNYVKNLLHHGFNAIGYDGNPNTYSYSKGVAHTLDLSEPFQLEQKFDWVISLEVGEHLPQKYESIFIENLINHCTHGIILSWAVKGQGGYGHFNCKNNDYIKTIFAKKGFINDIGAEKQLRKAARLSWFKNTIMVFRKP